MKITMKNKSLKKIQLILEIIRKKKRDNPKKETFEFPLEEFKKFSLLSDTIGLNQVFKRIQKETKENVIIGIYDPSFECKDPIAGKIIINKLPAVITHIENSEKLDAYYKKIEQQLKEKIPTLILNEEGELCRVDDKEKMLIYPMNPDKLRYKIVRYLALEKRWTPTKELAEEFEKETQKIRKTIEQIKRQIEKFLKIPGNEVVENKKGVGYRIKNVKIREN